MMISFEIPGDPVPQPRQRHALVRGSVRNYTPKDHPVNAYKESIRLFARHAFKNKKPLDCPIGVSIDATFSRPKSYKKSIQCDWHTKKPDADNIAKSCLDALTGLLWNDDAQVCELNVSKMTCESGGKPSTVIEIWWDAGKLK